MGTPRELWWGYAKNVIRTYPRRLGKDGQFSAIAQKEVDAVSDAIAQTAKLSNGADRLKLIELVFWKEPKRTVEGAGLKISVSTPTANRYHGDFIRLVGENLGLREKENGGGSA